VAAQGIVGTFPRGGKQRRNLISFSIEITLVQALPGEICEGTARSGEKTAKFCGGEPNK
jgi:hypothetical protein